MEIADGGVDYVSAPKDYAVLFELYYKYVVSLVERLGIVKDNCEDVASEILLRFYERDFLSKFDPTLVFTYKGELRPARFKSFLSKFVETYVRGHLDKQRRKQQRELLLNDEPMTNGSAKDWSEVGGTTWGELFAGTVSEEDFIVSGLDIESMIKHLRDYLITVPRRCRTDVCDLVALFDAVMAQINDGADGPDMKVLQHQFGVSPTAIYTWYHWLKINIAAALGLPAPKKRPRTVKPK